VLNINKLIITTLILLVPLVSVAIDNVHISNEMKKIAEEASNVNITPEMMERVRDTVKTINSQPYKKQMAAMRKAAENVVDIENNTLIDKEMKDAIKNGVLKGDFVYVFISSSMPKQALRNYVRHASKITNGVLVMRGFIGGASQVKPTARFIAEILRKDAFCDNPKCEMHNVEVQIDPILFKKHNITRVPAVTYVENVHFEGYCALKEEDLNKQENKFVVYGDVSLKYALKNIHEQTNSVSLLETIERMETGNNGKNI